MISGELLQNKTVFLLQKYLKSRAGVSLFFFFFQSCHEKTKSIPKTQAANFYFRDIID